MVPRATPDYGRYERFSLSLDGGVGFVTIENPPINLMDVTMMREMGRLARDTAADPSIRVLVFRSANPEFFIAHADVVSMVELDSSPAERSAELNPLHRIMEAWRRHPKATIAQIEGRARGGGSEFALSLDMRFAALDTAILSQPEVVLGIFPGAGGSQRLAKLVGRGRALEIILGGCDFTAAEAARYGYVNSALPAGQLGPYVEALAHRIASFPPETIRLAKESVDAALDSTWNDGLLDEAFYWQQAFAQEETRRRMRAFLQFGGQTRDSELDWQSLVDELSRG